MPVSLTTAKPGDRFEARDGEVWRYIRPTTNRLSGHMLSDRGGLEFDFCHDGSFWSPNKPCRHDLIRALDSPAPAPAEPMGDVGLVPDPAIARGFPDGTIDLTTFDAIETALDQADAPCLAGTRWLTLPERVAALAAALDEARKVIAPFGKAAEHWDDIPGVYRCHDNVELWQSTNARAGHLNVGQLRAARDWHSKHGRAADA